MRLHEYLRAKGRGEVQRLVRASGVSRATISNAARGMLVVRYDVAKSLSEATDGAVSIADLCERPDEAAQ